MTSDGNNFDYFPQSLISTFNKNFIKIAISVKVQFFLVIMCTCIAWKGHPRYHYVLCYQLVVFLFEQNKFLLLPRNDLYCVGQDIKPYSLTQIGRVLPPLSTPLFIYAMAHKKVNMYAKYRLSNCTVSGPVSLSYCSEGRLY